MIIAIEGIDNTGKTTQAKLLAERSGWTYIKFPNENLYSGKIIRKIINKELPFEPASFQALQILNRFETFARFDPEGKYIFDRYKLSGIIYGLADDLPEEWIRETCDFLPDPDITIILSGKPHREDADIYGEKQEKINELYMKEIQLRGYPVVIIDGKSIEEVHEEILKTLQEAV